MNEHKLEKAEELEREYYLHSKEYEKEKELDASKVYQQTLNNLNQDNGNEKHLSETQ